MRPVARLRNRFPVQNRGQLFASRPAELPAYRAYAPHQACPSEAALEPDRRKQIRQSCCRMRHQSRSEEHTSELQSLMRTSNAVFRLKKKKKDQKNNRTEHYL